MAELADRGCVNFNGGDEQTKILDATARAFIAVSGIVKAANTMCGEGTDAGPLPVLRRLVRVIIDDEQVAE